MKQNYSFICVPFTPEVQTEGFRTTRMPSHIFENMSYKTYPIK